MINQINIDKAIIGKIEERVRLLPSHVKQNKSNCWSHQSEGNGCSIRGSIVAVQLSELH
ncbi:hypothetical protein Hanom_Chr06g00557411 [Helianthus anomalus]